MNNNYKMPRLIFAGLFFFGFVSAAHSQTLDPGTLDRLRTALGQVRHPDQVDMLQMAQSIAPANTDAYLIAIAGQPTSVPGLRLRAYGLLGNFSASPATKAFLAQQVTRRELDDSYRQWALTSYVRAFHDLDPAGVETVVSSAERDPSLNLREHARVIHQKMRAGARHPAGELPRRQKAR